MESRFAQQEFERLDQIVRDGIQTYLKVGEALLEIKLRQLYKQEYDNWQDYCMDRVGYTARRVDQMIAGWQAYTVIENARSENPQLPSPTSEYQIRPIATKDTDEIIGAWQDTTIIHGDNPSGRQVKEVATRRDAAERNGYQPEDTSNPKKERHAATEALRRQVYGYPYALVKQRMNENRITPKGALEICVALESCAPKVRGEMLRLEVFNKTLIQELNRLHKRGSETYDEIVASGYIQLPDGAVPISQALPSHLRALLDLKYEEHRRRAAAERDAVQKIEMQALTVWTGPDEKVMQKNVAALESAIGADRLRRLCEHYLEMQANA